MAELTPVYAISIQPDLSPLSSTLAVDDGYIDGIYNVRVHTHTWTGWSIGVDLGGDNYSVTEIKLYDWIGIDPGSTWGSNDGTQDPHDILIVYKSNDNSTWTLVETFNPASRASRCSTLTLSQSHTARYFKVRTPGNYREPEGYEITMAEIEIFGAETETETKTFNSNSYIWNTVTGTFNSNSNTYDVETETFNSDSYIYDKETETKTFNSNSYIWSEETTTFNSNSNIYTEETITFNSNSYIYIEEIFNSNSYIWSEETTTFNSNSNIYFGATFVSNSYIYDVLTVTVTSDARIISRAGIENEYKVPRKIQPTMRNPDTTPQSGGKKRRGFRIF